MMGYIISQNPRATVTVLSRNILKICSPPSQLIIHGKRNGFCHRFNAITETDAPPTCSKKNRFILVEYSYIRRMPVFPRHATLFFIGDYSFAALTTSARGNAPCSPTYRLSASHRLNPPFTHVDTTFLPSAVSIQWFFQYSRFPVPCCRLRGPKYVEPVEPT